MRNVPLSKSQEKQIRDMKKANPRMRYRELGDKFGVTPSAICRVLTQTNDEPEAPKVRMLLPKVETPFVSIIRPIPLERLVAGNGRYARPIDPVAA